MKNSSRSHSFLIICPRICRFERRYSDEKRKFLSAGELALDADTGSLTYSGDYHFSPGDVLHLSTDGICGRVLTITSLLSDGRCVGDDAAYLIDGMEVYAVNAGEGGMTEGASYLKMFEVVAKARRSVNNGNDKTGAGVSG